MGGEERWGMDGDAVLVVLGGWEDTGEGARRQGGEE